MITRCIEEERKSVCFLRLVYHYYYHVNIFTAIIIFIINYYYHTNYHPPLPLWKSASTDRVVLRLDAVDPPLPPLFSPNWYLHDTLGRAYWSCTKYFNPTQTGYLRCHHIGITFLHERQLGTIWNLTGGGVGHFPPLCTRVFLSGFFFLQGKSCARIFWGNCPLHPLSPNPPPIPFPNPPLSPNLPPIPFPNPPPYPLPNPPLPSNI